ncbi:MULTISPECIES: phosphate signaling complex protein PhoU [Herbaspirillum]|uniref:phosphate signaling complex protein PhoU n=1 Tax=Herbaspirillum TaxID=963 RepID=UPI00067D6CEC|nr:MULTISPECIES: phosphate signaling complex protein PhoU [Herbaspirillum]
MQSHTSKQYDHELDDLLRGIAFMGGLVDRQIGHALEAMSGRYVSDPYGKIQATEDEINQYEIKLNQQCSHIIALRQPIANDLRLVMSVVKTVNDLERIGDETKKIGVTTVKLLESAHFTNILLQELTAMLTKARKLVAWALHALTEQDLSATAAILNEDSSIDADYNDVLKKLISFRLGTPEQVAAAVDLALIAKAIERIGDHATNIAESLVRVVKGKDISHLPRDSQTLQLQSD